MNKVNIIYALLYNTKRKINHQQAIQLTVLQYVYLIFETNIYYAPLVAIVIPFQIKHLGGNNTLPEYKVQEMKRSKFVLLHYGIFKIGWDWLILLCTFYIAIIVPYNAAFYLVDGPEKRASIVTDVIVEMLFIIGELLQLKITLQMCILLL